MSPHELTTEWRHRASGLRRYGAEEQAITLLECAGELEQAWKLWQEEPLTLAEAAEESGYSPDHLGRRVREGKIPNAGEPGSPRIARADLPIKPKRRSGAVAETAPSSHTDNRQVVQSIIDEGVA